MQRVMRGLGGGGRCRCRRRCSSSSSSSSAPAAGPAGGGDILRKAARYIEEDGRLAESLGQTLTPEVRQALGKCLDGMTFRVQEPSSLALRRVALQNAVPFIGFGIMDNSIMIVAGESIDLTFGIALGISTMAAAALGNLVSDVFGVGLGGVIEDVAAKLGMPDPGLSRGQMLLPRVRRAAHLGCAVGVSIGCFIGMFPLLFMPDNSKIEEMKHKERFVGVLDAVMQEASKIIGCEKVTLYLLEDETKELQETLSAAVRRSVHTLSRTHSKTQQEGVAQVISKGGCTINVPSSRRARGSVSMAVLGRTGQCVGVVHAIALEGKSFTEEDEHRLSAMCSHISVGLENAKSSDASAKLNLMEQVRLLGDHAKLTSGAGGS